MATTIIQQEQTTHKAQGLNAYTHNAKMNGPEKKISTGAISVTIWKNSSKLPNGNAAEYETISLQRNYKDAQGNWKTTTSMRVNDLPKAALALSKAYEYLVLKDEQGMEQ